MRVIIGAGDTTQDGFQSLEENQLDITNLNDWLYYFTPGTLETILAEHVFEHLTTDEVRQATQNCYYMLQYGGRLRMAVPDGYNHTRNFSYIRWTMPGNLINGDDHKQLFNYKSLSQILNEFGFSVYLLEYFDEFGEFHKNEWRREDGDIRRSDGTFLTFLHSVISGSRYTSLIVDGIK